MLWSDISNRHPLPRYYNELKMYICTFNIWKQQKWRRSPSLTSWNIILNSRQLAPSSTIPDLKIIFLKMNYERKKVNNSEDCTLFSYARSRLRASTVSRVYIDCIPTILFATGIARQEGVRNGSRQLQSRRQWRKWNAKKSGKDAPRTNKIL